MSTNLGTRAATNEREDKFFAEVDESDRKIGELDAQLDALVEQRIQLVLDQIKDTFQLVCSEMRDMRFTGERLGDNFRNTGGLEVRCGHIAEYVRPENPWVDMHDAPDWFENRLYRYKIQERVLWDPAHFTIEENVGPDYPRGDHYVHSFFDNHLERLGVHQENHAAVSALKELPWWSLAADSPEVEILRTVHTNP